MNPAVYDFINKNYLYETNKEGIHIDTIIQQFVLEEGVSISRQDMVRYILNFYRTINELDEDDNSSVIYVNYKVYNIQPKTKLFL